MNDSGSASPLRPLIVGGLLGFILGLIIGLYYAWEVKPVTYAAGAFPNEMTTGFQQDYVSAVAEAYLTTGDVTAAANRLRTFSPVDQVRLLAGVAANFSSSGRAAEVAQLGNLASQLRNQLGWSSDQISAGLQASNPPPEFSEALGMVPQAADQTPAETQPQPTTAPPSTGGGINPLTIGLLLVLVIALVVGLLLYRMRAQPQTTAEPIPMDAAAEAGGLQPLRQWVGTYTFGQDNYDESFTIETAESDFLGECGMGILEGFASGSPRKVLAFDVWLFDKTDIRTVSMPVMSKFSFDDEVLRGKLSPDATPILATEGQTFDIETTALIVKATVDEVAYGDEKPEMSYFSKLKVSLTAYLKPDVDVSGTMPIPEEYA